MGVLGNRFQFYRQSFKRPKSILKNNGFVVVICNIIVIFVMKYSELIRKLKDAGCWVDSPGAEHDRWYSPITDSFFYVPRHQSKEVPTGTLRRLMKESGI